MSNLVIEFKQDRNIIIAEIIHQAEILGRGESFNALIYKPKDEDIVPILIDSRDSPEIAYGALPFEDIEKVMCIFVRGEDTTQDVNKMCFSFNDEEEAFGFMSTAIDAVNNYNEVLGG